MLQNEQDILQAIEDDAWMMNILRAAAQLELPEWIIGAGFVRNFVWDMQHGFAPSHKNNDIDLIYFDQENAEPVSDKLHEQRLHEILPDVHWEVTNQAHIHTYNDEMRPPYTSAEDGLAHWTETATCVGVTLQDNRLQLVAPWGIDDLLQLKLRIPPCHHGSKLYEELFMRRITAKRWLTTWPKLTIDRTETPSSVIISV